MNQQAQVKRYLRMSSLGNCALQVCHKILGNERTHPRDQRFENIMRLGTAAEEIVVDLLRKEGHNLVAVLRWQMTVYSRLGFVPLEGHPDGLILATEPESENLVILEIKAPGQWAYDRWLRDGVRRGSPQYASQAFGYQRGVSNLLHSLKERRDVGRNPVLKALLPYAGREVTRTRFEVFNRNSGARMKPPEYLEFDQGWWDGLRLKWEYVWDCLAEDKLPDPDHNGRVWQCDYCEFRGLCPAWKQAQKEGWRILDASHIPGAVTAIADYRQGQILMNQAKDTLRKCLVKYGYDALTVGKKGAGAELRPETRRSYLMPALLRHMTPEEVESCVEKNSYKKLVIKIGRK